MKISLALLILLLAAAWTGSQGNSPRGSGGDCCLTFSGKIPKCKIQTFRDSPPTCNLKAVLVKFHCVDRWFCVDPEEKRFQDHLKKQKKSNSTST